MELWKNVLGFDVLYEVSNLGRVRTLYDRFKGYTDQYKYLTPTDNDNGYLRFNFKLNGKSKTVYLHKLVAQAFVPNNQNYQEVNHIDENKYNCCASNLEWCDHKYNCNYGTRNLRSGLKNCKKIKCVETNIIYNSIDEASKKLNIIKTAICNCLNGRSKSCGGYRWEYV